MLHITCWWVLRKTKTSFSENRVSLRVLYVTYIRDLCLLEEFDLLDECVYFLNKSFMSKAIYIWVSVFLKFWSSGEPFFRLFVLCCLLGVEVLFKLLIVNHVVVSFVS